MNPHNAKAHRSLALYRIYAPGFAGGSLEKGLAQLDEVLKCDDRGDIYISHYFKAVALLKQENYDAALDSINSGLAMFPKNKGALDLKKQILAARAETRPGN